MATNISSIGTATRDYSTIQAWEDATDNNLISAKDIEQGECYNDSEFTPSSAITITGATTNATYYRVLTVASGESFQDHANKATNALRYNQSNGVGIASTAGYANALVINESNFQLRRIQLKATGTAVPAALEVATGADGGTIKDIIVTNTSSTNTGVARVRGDGSHINCLYYQSASGRANVLYGTEGDYVNCNFIGPDDLATAPTNGINLGYSSATFANCCVFGCTNYDAGNSTKTYTTCATDLASPPSGVTGSLTYSSQFENINLSTLDCRLKSGSDLENAGTTDSDSPQDIIGTTRSTQDIGVWEFVGAATGSSHRTPGGGWGGRVICG